MGYVVSKHGGNLLVAAEAVDERSISHALSRIPNPHGRLFLDVDVNEQYRCVEYKVRLRLSTGEAPFVTAWRDEQGRPLPLSSALTEHVKMLIETDTLRQATEHNRRFRESSVKDMGDEVEEIARDMLPYIQGRKSSPLHRSVSLRMARSRTGRGR